MTVAMKNQYSKMSIQHIIRVDALFIGTAAAAAGRYFFLFHTIMQFSLLHDCQLPVTVNCFVYFSQPAVNTGRQRVTAM